MSNATYSTLIQEAIAACDGLVSIMEEETICLQENRIELVEEIAASKGRLAAKLEALLAQVKSMTASLEKAAAEADLSDELKALKDAIARIEKPANENFNLLQARHAATSNFLTAVRQALAKPQPKTYGNSGQVAESGENTALINRSI